MDLIRRHPELDIYFRDAGHSDVKVIEGEASLRQFVAAMLSYHP